MKPRKDEALSKRSVGGCGLRVDQRNPRRDRENRHLNTSPMQCENHSVREKDYCVVRKERSMNREVSERNSECLPSILPGV